MRLEVRRFAKQQTKYSITVTRPSTNVPSSISSSSNTPARSSKSWAGTAPVPPHEFPHSQVAAPSPDYSKANESSAPPVASKSPRKIRNRENPPQIPAPRWPAPYPYHHLATHKRAIYS